MSFLIDTYISNVKSPAFVYNENEILSKINIIKNISKLASCKIYFPLKAFSFPDALKFMGEYIDGFSASSLFEARLAFEMINAKEKSIHITSPFIVDEELSSVITYCNSISFNSLGQWQRLRGMAKDKISCGLRINPGSLFVKDVRYDPCRRHSKLGIPIKILSSNFNKHSDWMEGVSGLHFHTNCESTNFGELLATVNLICKHLPQVLDRIDWINIGGGYLFESEQDFEHFIEAVLFLKKKFDIQVIFEPGKGIIGQAGSIVSTVVDIFLNDGHNIAILDTTTNHMPEVFEYQFKPDVAQESDEGKYSYILAGSTCLAGDIFGEYRFDKPLKIGSRIVFENMGAYTLVKANMFNGINLPTIYAYTQDGKLEMKRQFTYDDFLSRCGGR
ncbi:MAG: hypothetical protein PHU44_00060 [Syntrophales bacterium]|nr:hypothetical protein [Syntrophales bacterium]